MRFKTLVALLFGSLVLSVASAAVVNSVTTQTPQGQPDTILYTWTPLLNGDTGQGVPSATYADRTMSVTGTFGTGGSVQMEGSNDGATWSLVTDLSGATIVKVAAGVSVIAENPLFMRPHVTAGDGSTSLTVTMVGKR
jgi:Flp pilus assembly protein TadG